MQNQIKFLQQKLDELKTTVQPLLPLAEVMQKHFTELQSAKEAIDSFVKQLDEVVPMIKQIIPRIPKIMSMSKAFAPSQYPLC